MPTHYLASADMVSVRSDNGSSSYDTNVSTEYAASFFLLGDNLQGAVNILSSQLGDLQLAIAVARVYEGDNGPVLGALLEEKVLPRAVEENNEWLASWAFWMLGDRGKALRALTVSFTPKMPLINQLMEIRILSARLYKDSRHSRGPGSCTPHRILTLLCYTDCYEIKL